MLLKVFLVAVSCTLMLVGCSDESEVFVLPPVSDTSNTPEEKEAPRWLKAHHLIDPADWLVMRSQSALNGNITDKKHRTNLLNAAAHHFRGGNQRMIANRAVQLEDMLLEIGIEKSAVSLIEDFTHLPTSGTPHTFSAYCQYYFNMREQGKTHDHALNILSKLK